MNTLGRTGSTQANEMDHTNSLDKRTYLPSYVGKSCYFFVYGFGYGLPTAAITSVHRLLIF